jgi:hypothetical protein
VSAARQADRARESAAEALAEGERLVEANQKLRRTTGELKRSNDELERAVGELKRSNDDVATTLARSLIEPLALHGGFPLQVQVSDLEWEALWELTANRGSGLGYRFVQEATAAPLTSRQLRDRADLALHAAVGLDPRRRQEVEALLLSRLDDTRLSKAHRADLTLAAARWGGLSRPAARRVARLLVEALKDLKDPDALSLLPGALTTVLALMGPREAAVVSPRAAAALAQALQGFKKNEDYRSVEALTQALAAVAGRLGPRDAAQVAATLNQQMDKSSVALHARAEALSAMAARLESRAAARVVSQPAAMLAENLVRYRAGPAGDPYRRALHVLASHLDAGDAARIVELLMDAPGFSGFSYEVHTLLALTARLEPSDAAKVIAQAMSRAWDQRGALWSMPKVLSELAPRLKPTEAALAASTLTQAIKDHENAPTLSDLAAGVSALAPRLDARDAAPIARTLTQTLKVAKDGFEVRNLALALSAVAARLEPQEAAATLLQACKDAKGTVVLSTLVQGLPDAAARLEPREARDLARKAVAILTQGIRQTLSDKKLQYEMIPLAQALVKVGVRLEPGEAAAATAPIVASLTQAIEKDENYSSLGPRISALLAVVAGMEPHEAAATLTQAFRKVKEPFSLTLLVQRLPDVAARLGPKEASRATVILTRAIKEAKNEYAIGTLAEGLGALAARLEPGEAAEAVATLRQAIKGVKDPHALARLVRVLAAAGVPLPPEEAARIAGILIQDMNDSNITNRLDYLTPALVALAPQLSPQDASRCTARLFLALRALRSTVFSREPLWKDRTAGWCLAALLSGSSLPPAFTWRFAAAIPVAADGQALNALAFLVPETVHPPARLSTQQLVEFLKMPTCVDEGRRFVLDYLGVRYQRYFADHWEFVRFANQQGLALDFTRPPERPEESRASTVTSR